MDIERIYMRFIITCENIMVFTLVHEEFAFWRFECILNLLIFYILSGMNCDVIKALWTILL